MSGTTLSQDEILAVTSRRAFSARGQKLIDSHIQACRKEFGLPMEILYQNDPEEWREAGLLRYRPAAGSRETVMLVNADTGPGLLGRPRAYVYSFYSALGNRDWLPLGAFARLGNALTATSRLYIPGSGDGEEDDRYPPEEHGFARRQPVEAMAANTRFKG